MAFVQQNNANGQDKTAAANWSPVVGAAASAGNLLVVTLAKDNTSTAADGDNGEVTSVTDSKGNAYTKAIEFTNVQGGAAAGATVSVWYSVLATALLSTDTFTFNFASCTAKAMGWATFTFGAGNTIGVDQTGTSATDGLDAASISLTPSKGNIEYLFWRADAHETATTTWSPTAGGNYVAAHTKIATSGGSDVTNMMASTERRVFTTNSAEATDPSCTAVDHASAMVSFYEVAAPSAPVRPFAPIPFIPAGRSM